MPEEEKAEKNLLLALEQNKFYFDSSFRLTSKADFNYLKIESTRISSAFFVAYIKKSRLSENKTRIGLAVSKKLGKAPQRNRIKRFSREAFRTSNFKSLGLDILIVPKSMKRSEFDSMSFQDFSGQFAYLFNKIVVKNSNF